MAAAGAPARIWRGAGLLQAGPAGARVSQKEGSPSSRCSLALFLTPAFPRILFFLGLSFSLFPRGEFP